jgi:hypothetical protein
MWMLLFNATFFEDRRLCNPYCDKSAIAVLSAACQGLCNSPSDMRALHAQERCTDDFAPGSPASLNSLKKVGTSDASETGIAAAAAAMGADTAETQTTAADKQEQADADGSLWEEEVLWKLPAAPWHKHEIFAMMQEEIRAPGGLM